MTIRALIRLARPVDWLKGVFIVLPLPFALAAGASWRPWEFLAGLLAFSLAASAVYAVNDVFDAARDRLDPKKQQRPVASGAVSPGVALAFGAVLALASALLALRVAGPDALLVIGIYFAANAVYDLGGKSLPLVDVALLSSGFVLRVVFGCVLLGVTPSSWLLLCSSMLALFLALGKRRGDLARGLGAAQRAVLASYSLAFLDQAMAITAATIIGSYAIYCIDSGTLLAGREFASLPFVIVGVLEYLRRIQFEKDVSSPVEVVARSWLLLACGLGWLLAVAASVPLR